MPGLRLPFGQPDIPGGNSRPRDTLFHSLIAMRRDLSVPLEYLHLPGHCSTKYEQLLARLAGLPLQTPIGNSSIAQTTGPVPRAYKFAAFWGRGQSAVHSARARGVACAEGGNAEAGKTEWSAKEYVRRWFPVCGRRAGLRATGIRDFPHMLEPGDCSSGLAPPLAGRGEVS